MNVAQITKRHINLSHYWLVLPMAVRYINDTIATQMHVGRGQPNDSIMAVQYINDTIATQMHVENNITTVQWQYNI